ncbi:MAG TPA: hypothetical protein VMZ26_09340 [Pyrinomonadaceae bacterium]|nr:hypothetical protein [Pyrinomonadaceae bacterium]
MAPDTVAGRNNFRRMYLIEPKMLNQTRQQQQQQTIATSVGEGKTATTIEPMVTSSEVRGVQSRVKRLDAEMEDILNRVNVDVSEKLRLYLETLRKYIMSTQRLNRLVEPGVLPPIVIRDVQQQQSETSPPPPLPALQPPIITAAATTEGKKTKTTKTDVVPAKQTPQKQQPLVEPSTSSQADVPSLSTTTTHKTSSNIDEEDEEIELAATSATPARLPAGHPIERYAPYEDIKYSMHNIMRQFPGKVRAEAVADVLDTVRKGTIGNNDRITWDESTGQISVNGETIPESNIVELMHHFTHSPIIKDKKIPPYYVAVRTSLLAEQSIKSRQKTFLVRSKRPEMVGKGLAAHATSVAKRARVSEPVWLRF